LVVGPGLGRQPPRASFLQAVLARRPVPVVLDADALTLFQGTADRPMVLTPHLGEFRAQFDDELADQAANDRWAAVAKAAQKVKGTVLLKGVPTVIADLRGPAGLRCSRSWSRPKRREGAPAGSRWRVRHAARHVRAARLRGRARPGRRLRAGVARCADARDQHRPVARRRSLSHGLAHAPR